VVGLAGIATGAGFGLASLSEHNTAAKGPCPDPTKPCPCSDPGEPCAEWASAVRNGNISTWAFVAGGAVSASAVVLWVLSPPATSEAKKTAQVWLTASPSMMRLQGTW
jgi:hypothetical protein